ncbi:MAG: DUF6364 family protein [Opitutaceae bacterium]|nr:DUF6364 family protein [Opitutaceae bacterium]
MTATLQVTLDPRVLEHAEQEARRRRTTVAEVVARQLQVMALNWQDSEAGKTPLTDELRGAISLPPQFDARDELTKQLARKHGS